jgi:hypothetical protein
MANEESAYIIFSNDAGGREKAMAEYGQNIDAYGPAGKAKADYEGRRFIGIEPNISVKSEYNRGDYEHYRPNERTPKTIIEKVAACLAAYDDFGIVHNIVDLMGDFGSQGIRIAHPIPKVERFYQEWFQIVKGKERSNMFLNLLYRCGNVVTRRLNGKISVKTSEQWAKAESGAPSTEAPKIDKREVPLKYLFYTPMAIEVIGGTIAAFSSQPRYALKLSGLQQGIKNTIGSSTQINNEIIASLPQEVQEAILGGKKYVPLNADDIAVYSYKKNDWDIWATPMVSPVLADLYRLEKLKLADMSALDGVISNIRLWNLGIIADNPLNSILPTKAGINRLNNILANNVAGGVMDLVWGPELKMTESNSTAYKFLGEEKYKAVLDAIYSGLGIPQSLVGGGGTAMTNNYMSLKTLIERLEYGRELLVDFWKKELKRVQKAMGHKQCATIIFDEMVLSDEAAQTTLLLQMLDRNIISEETVRDKIKVDNDIEKVRVNREYRKRNNEDIPPKAGPFHNPQTEEEMKKISLQNGDITPSEVNMDLSPRKKGEKSRTEQQIEMQKSKVPVKTVPKKSQLDGRPKNSKDSKKRKEKRVLPKTKGEQVSFAELMLWAEDGHKQVTDMVSKAVLSGLDKKNLRMLTEEEFGGLEELKFAVFTNLEPFEQITAEKVYSILEGDKPVNPTVKCTTNEILSSFLAKNGRKPNADEMRKIQISAYIMNYQGDKDGAD